jgi:hypothetical protein
MRAFCFRRPGPTRRLRAATAVCALACALVPRPAPALEFKSPNEIATGQFGYSVSGISDVNGDGRGDVIIGAIRDNPQGITPNPGRAYIFDGFTGELLHTLRAANENVNGLSAGRFGAAVSGVPDFNLERLAALLSDHAQGSQTGDCALC